MSTHVFFFGGYNASRTAMSTWETTAAAQRRSVTFKAIPYPSSDPSAAAADRFSKSEDFKKLITEINGIISSSAASTSGAGSGTGSGSATNSDEIYIVGHSSGCAIANKVDESLITKSGVEVVLVALDGFSPNKTQLKRQSTQIWEARSQDGKLPSRNHHDQPDGSRHGGTGAIYKVFRAPNTNCTTDIALHFVLVNLTANDSITWDNYGTKHGIKAEDLAKKKPQDYDQGYANCRPNLMWLDVIQLKHESIHVRT